MKSPSVEFQLFFVRNNVDFSGDIAQLDSTEYVLSNIASVAFSSTIRSKPGCNPCYPSNPQTEPGLMGWTNFFKDFSVLVPVKASLDESIDRIAFDFKTYLGRNDCHVPLNVPYLDSSGTVPAKFLKMITEWYSDSGYFLPTDENLPSALLVHSSLVEKTDRTMAIAPWYENLEYNIGSTVIGSDGRIYRSLQEHNIGNNPIESELWQRIMEYDAITDSWNEEPKSDMVPSERLVYYALMEKADKVMPVYPWQSNWTYDIGAQVLGSDGRVYRSLLQNNIGNDPTTTDVWTLSLERMDITTQWNDPTSDSLVPSEKLVKDFDVRCPGISTAAGSLSGGNIQKVILAREIERKPRFLIAVYPTRGLDLGAVEFIHQQLLAIRREGIGVLLISEELDEIMDLSDRIAVIYKGSIQKVLDHDEATRARLGVLMAGVKEE